MVKTSELKATPVVEKNTLKATPEAKTNDLKIAPMVKKSTIKTNGKIYIIKMGDRSRIVNKKYFEAEVKACYQLGVPYVVNRTSVSRELVVIV